MQYALRNTYYIYILVIPCRPMILIRYTHIHTRTLILSHTLSHKLTLSHSHTLTLSHYHTHTYSVCRTLTLSLTYTHSHTHTLSHTHSHSLIHSHSHTHQEIICTIIVASIVRIPYINTNIFVLIYK